MTPETVRKYLSSKHSNAMRKRRNREPPEKTAGRIAAYVTRHGPALSRAILSRVGIKSAKLRKALKEGQTRGLFLVTSVKGPGPTGKKVTVSPIDRVGREELS